MATLVSRALMQGLTDLRYEPTSKRVRAVASGQTVVDSRRAVIVWEPKRIVPSYAVPDSDVTADLVPAQVTDADEHPVRIGADGPPVLDPRTSFAVHSCDGDPLTLQAEGVALVGAAFRPADPDLAGYVVLDFDAFDQWLEEDEPIVSHVRDPFKRIDIRRSSSRVQIEVGGVTVADSTAPLLLFETTLGPRFYLPREDVRMDLLTPSPTRTTCAYKGEASYFSVEVNGQVHPDVAWTYADPLSDARDVKDLIAFFDEHVDVRLDGVLRERPVTPWS